MHPEIKFGEDGIPRSSEFDDVYHSIHGGRAQAEHVFIRGNHLLERWREASLLKKDDFVILETGFGLGVNFFATLYAWSQHAFRTDHRPSLSFISIEKYLPRSEDVQRVWEEMIKGLAVPHQKIFQALLDILMNHWPKSFGEHRIEFSQLGVHLHLWVMDVHQALEHLSNDARESHLGRRSVDAVYLDGFNPIKNPQMWSQDVFTGVASLSHAQTTFATWAVSRKVKDGLENAGFQMIKLPGFKGKREMLTGLYVGELKKGS